MIVEEFGVHPKVECWERPATYWIVSVVVAAVGIAAGIVIAALK